MEVDLAGNDVHHRLVLPLYGSLDGQGTGDALSGYEVIRLPPMSPNLNAYAEHFVRSIKDECLIGSSSWADRCGERSPSPT